MGIRVLQFRRRDDEDEGRDVSRLTAVAASRGCLLPDGDAVQIWKAHCDMYAASWLDMHGYEDEELWSIISTYTT